MTTIDLNQLSTLPLVLREKGSGTREFIEQLILNHMPGQVEYNYFR
ncbi:hypothetical protein [Basfia succiniciproducens]|nr:hypothetical protein [Basfia succiniciproducens]